MRASEQWVGAHARAARRGTHMPAARVRQALEATQLAVPSGPEVNVEPMGHTHCQYGYCDCSTQRVVPSPVGAACAAHCCAPKWPSAQGRLTTPPCVHRAGAPLAG